MADDRQQNFGKWLQLLSQKFPSGFAVRKAARWQINQSFHTKPNMALILAGVLKKTQKYLVFNLDDNENWCYLD